jgi:hypothetical protein
MNLTKRNSRVRVKELAIGQIWRAGQAELHVKDIGKMLVHYKLFSGKMKKPTTTVSAIRAVQSYLSEHKATLVRVQAAPAVAK